MNTLHIRDVPDDVYQQLQQLAKTHNQSLSAQVVMMLTEALEEERRKNQATILASIHQRRFTPPDESPSSLELLHEDRER